MALTPPARKIRQPITPQTQTTMVNPPSSPASLPETNRPRVTLAEAGFVSPALIVKPAGSQYRRLMLSLEGIRGSGKSEFACSAPGPGAVLVLDRGIDSVLTNPDPPTTRADNFLFQVIKVPKASQFGSQEQYLEYWRVFYKILMDAINSIDGRTTVLDGDPDSWELQRLAEFGRLSKVPPNLYDNVNAARRLLYARCYDSGKIVIATSRVREIWQTKLNPLTNKPEINNSGNEIREPTGKYERQGFNDAGHVWTIQLFCFYDEERKEFGCRILECKANKKLNGQELRGDECNFASLVSLVYPDVPLEEWGY